MAIYSEIFSAMWYIKNDLNKRNMISHRLGHDFLIKFAVKVFI